jgi:hypothetical protein
LNTAASLGSLLAVATLLVAVALPQMTKSALDNVIYALIDWAQLKD